MRLRSLLRGQHHFKGDRDAAVRLAAAEAAQDDPLFDANLVRERAVGLFMAVQRAWSADDVSALGRLVGSELMVEWEARLGPRRMSELRHALEDLREITDL